MVSDFCPAVRRPKTPGEDALWFALQRDLLVVFEDDEGIMVPQAASIESLGIPAANEHYLGQYLEQDCFAVEVPADAILPPDYQTAHLYQLLDGEDDTLFQLAGRAKQIVEWDKNHRFCSRCGSETESHREDRAKHCQNCEYMAYPRLAPSVIVLVTRGDDLLLARSPHFPPRMFSTLAGFVEVGETIEECVEREIFEEVGLRVKNARYQSSQPWPFPHSLMIGFHAEYDSGDIVVDGKEIVDARWWSVNELPQMPPVGSISRRLIDTYVHKRRGSKSGF